MSGKWNIKVMIIIGKLQLIVMDMGHRLMTYVGLLRVGMNQ
jgi:hypothetical protein